VLQVVGGAEGLTDRTASLAVSISQLLAVFMSHKRAVEVAARVQGAQEAARVKAVIVSAVSHELKTPLAAAIAGVTDLESEDVTRGSDDARMMLHRVTENLERLENAIADLLDLSRLQADEWMPQPELYEAGEILGDVVEAVPTELRERLVFRVSSSPAPEVYVDFAQISRALRAVLDNAVTYSPAGPIVLGAERRDDRTLVWIEDRGPGVSDDDKPFVFDRAYRGEAGVGHPGGTGLGLTIARDLVEANAGRLRVEDAEPKGTRILVDLPASADSGDTHG
jgi:two-component system sensor histidine kinase KdpD